MSNAAGVAVRLSGRRAASTKKSDAKPEEVSHILIPLTKDLAELLDAKVRAAVLSHYQKPSHSPEQLRAAEEIASRQGLPAASSFLREQLQKNRKRIPSRTSVALTILRKALLQQNS